MAVDASADLTALNSALELIQTGRFSDSISDLRLLLNRIPFDEQTLGRLIDASLAAGEISFASEIAQRVAFLDRGRPLLDRNFGGRDYNTGPANMLSLGKLHHDAEQLRYLMKKGVLDFGYEQVASAYEHAISELELGDDAARADITSSNDPILLRCFSRNLHVASIPRTEGNAISLAHAPSEIEARFLHHPLGLVVIDDFLTDEALHGLRKFCLESTIWHANRYSHGRLGAFFRGGFSTPLLAQIAEELRDLFPRIIGRRHALTQIWGFKYGYMQPRMPAHADFAAVNVNFWLTDERANLTPDHGGLVLYDVEAPEDWSHHDYNRNGQAITQYLAAQQAKGLYVPYKANRAVIFNSRLFHRTELFRFGERYEDRRVNVTMLYGRRGRLGRRLRRAPQPSATMAPSASPRDW